MLLIMGKYFTKRRTICSIFLVLLIAGIYAFSMPQVKAQEYNSSSYKVDELFIGAGGTNNASSANFQGRVSIGDLGVGNSVGTAYQAYGGFTTTAAPELELIVPVVNIDLGVLTTGGASYTSATFQVRTYLASGYVVYTEGNAPTNESGATISPLISGGTSSPGTEQFGINLVDNSSPNIGADPTQLPDASFSFGAAATGYGTANTFRYNSGEAIAQSTESSGLTEYTISYLYNINGTTEAGLYIFNQSVVAVSTF